MRKLALIPLLALAVTACAEDPTQPGHGRPMPGLQLNTTSSSPGAMLLGTTRGSRWSEPFTLSSLVEIDPATGATLGTIGPVGYAVNGLEYDATTGKLYGSTPAWDPSYVGLIEIDPNTGAGTPVGVHGWGLPGDGDAVITNITVNSQGRMFGWWEFGLWEGEIIEDDLVSIDKATGLATRVGESGVATFVNGLDFDNSDVLYMVNWGGPVHTVDPVTGAATSTGSIGTNAHHGDFDPSSNLYYGISGDPWPDPPPQQALVVADLSINTVIESFDNFADDIHTITFYQPRRVPQAPLSVHIDIKPRSCRNPVNARARGVLPIAILGTGEFDVTQVDPKTVQLQGVPALWSSVRDVATPYEGTPEDAYDCTREGRDGWDDLTLKFDNQEIVEALGDIEDGDVLLLTLTANLTEEFGGSDIEGLDVVVILKKGKHRRPPWIGRGWPWARRGRG
jgi:hypothetical protein